MNTIPNDSIIKYNIEIAMFCSAAPMNHATVDEKENEYELYHFKLTGWQNEVRFFVQEDRTKEYLLDEDHPYSAYCLNFHRDYNWLMPVVGALSSKLDAYDVPATIRIYEKWVFYKNQITYALARNMILGAFIATYQACKMYREVMADVEQLTNVIK